GYLGAAFSPDGKTLALGNGPRVELRSLATGEALSAGHGDEGHFVALTADGRVVATDGGDGITRLWEAGTGKELGRSEGGRKLGPWASRRFGFAADGKTLLWSDGQSVRQFEAGTGKEERRAAIEDGRASQAVSPDGRYVVTGGVGGRVLLLDDRG